MKRSVLFIVFALTSLSLYAQSSFRIDTLYYDEEWKGAVHKAFAEYYRIALYPSDPSAKKVFRDYYVDGTLQAKGEFISIDPNDDSKSVFNGVVESFYKNGKKERSKAYVNGRLDGDYVEYGDNGLIKKKCSYVDGARNGLYTEFGENGSYLQIEYSKGKPVHDYFVFCDPAGHVVKLKLSDQSIYWESPDLTERKTVYKDDKSWYVYSKNGVTVAESCSLSNDHGKWYKLDIIISNDSVTPIEFDPQTCITAYSINSKLKPTILDVWSSEDYIDKVKGDQALLSVIAGIGEGLAVANAGYSTSTTTTSGAYIGSVSAQGVASTLGLSSSSTSYYYGQATATGFGTSTSTTKSYNAAEAYQARVLSQKRMADFDYSQWQERKAKEVGYLKRNTIQPGETISGYINVQRIDHVRMFNQIFIGEASYPFSWTSSDNKNTTTEGIDYISNYANNQMDDIEPLFGKNDKQYYQKVEEFLNWFAKSGIRNPQTVARVLDFEKSFFTHQFDQIDALMADRKTSRAELLLGDVQAIYERLPIHLKYIDQRLEGYYNVLTPKARKTFEDGIYAR